MRELLEKIEGKLIPMDRLRAMQRKYDAELRQGLKKKKHMMLTKAILNKLPPLYSTGNDKDPKVMVSFFNPYGAGTWLATEYDPASKTFFGYVMGLMQGVGELGYFTLDELAGNGVERDEQWRPMKLSAAKRHVLNAHGMDDRGSSAGRKADSTGKKDAER